MRLPSYRKHSSRDVGFAEFRGHRHYFPGRYNSGESFSAYQQFLIDNVLDGDKHKLTTRRSICVAELVAEFLEFAATHYKPRSRGTNSYYNFIYALKPFAAKYGECSCESFGPLKLTEWQLHLASGGKQARNYINQQIARIRHAFKWGVSRELIPESVYSSLATVAPLRKGATKAKELPKKKPVEMEHVDAILPDLGPTIRAMVLLQVHTGARSDSICTATPEQFTRENDLLLWRPHHKTEHLDKELVLPIGPKCQEVLQPFLSRPADKPMFAPEDARKNARYHEAYSSATYRRAIHRAIERYNVNIVRFAKQLGVEPVLMPIWSPHQLRHAKGHFVRANYGIEAAQAVLGHDSLDATQIYSARQLELAKTVARETG